ncbi:MAG: dTDP-glucose 4,6-dehydratase [Candidatus Omnitrophica bacterium]|nr:dTDP-glucose 4,6-dehydratase [Candidatus Omnitrophota bacterium]
MNNILITGGCGFIGSNFIRYLLANSNYRVVNLDCLTYAGNLENLISVETNPKYKFFKGNICDSSLVSEIIKNEKIDCIINFAAESHVDRSILDASIFVQTNVLGTQTLLESARKTEIKRYIQISTDEVYGSLGAEGYFTETTPIAPNSPYSASKAGGDLLVRSYVETYNFPALIMRCSNNYGPFQFPEKFIPLIIANALNDKAIPLYGDGLNIRDWIFVEDFCRAIHCVLEKGRIGEVYNVGGNSEKNNKELVKIILERLNKPESLVTKVTDRLGHDRRYAIDYSKINQELGWEPLCKFEEGIQQTIDWYVNNKQWINNVCSQRYLDYYARNYKGLEK